MGISKNKILWMVVWVAITAAVFSWSGFNTSVAQETPTTNTSLTDKLQADIEAQRKVLDELKSKGESLQKSVEDASREVRDIQGQISLIDSQIAQSTFAVQAKQQEIKTVELEMLSIQQSIDEKTKLIETQRTQLADALRQLDANTRVSGLALVLTHDSFSEFFSQAQAVAELTDSLQEGIGELQSLREDLQSKQDALVDTRDAYRQAKLQLEIQRDAIVDQKELKTDLLSDAKNSASSYQQLLAQRQKEEAQANATINALERQLSAQLKAGNTNTPVFSSKGFVWPLTGRISALFHDPDYPFRRYIGEHTGLDIAAPQGTPVRASADGIVSVVHDRGWITDTAGRKLQSALNYVGIIHQDGISTRYLHLSAVYVHADQFVRQGEIIGLSGGLPGTIGAGTTTTGAHLHFEVRVSGLPDDPLGYLP